MGLMDRLLYRAKDAKLLGIFRLIFGILMFAECLRIVKMNVISDGLLKPQIALKYPFMDWIPTGTATTLYLSLAVLFVSSLLIALGKWTKWAAGLGLVAFCFIFLQDNTMYNNHLYMYALLFFLFTFVDADAVFTLSDGFGKKGERAAIPAWNYNIFKFLVFIVYFFGGIAKLSSSWLSGKVPSAIIGQLPADSVFLSLFGKTFGTTFLQYGGLLFDLSIGSLLLFKPTRKFAVVALIIFNLMNGNVLFNDIGLFPYFMLACTLLFFDRDAEGEPSLIGKSSLVTGLIAAFVAIQVLVPIRGNFLCENPEWYGPGSKFSWRMKMHTRTVDDIDIRINDTKSDASSQVFLNSFLNSNQIKHLTNEPRNLITVANFFRDYAKQKFKVDANISMKPMISFNGSSKMPMLKPNTDLNALPFNSTNTSWLNPPK